jgi:TRAP transporter 4TM/12TM fusion protein
MGSINGSAVANVVTTGAFTIPLMKKVGFPPVFAGAVEAAASTGGQLLPPVMGAAAFVMADVTGTAYSQIIIAAIIPGLLYYIALGVMVYLEACKKGIKKETAEKLPQLLKVLKEGWFYSLPIITLIVMLLGAGFSANYSAIFAIAVLLVVGIIQSLVKEKKFPLEKMYNALIKAMKAAIPVAMACACAGVVIGIVSMTGIGVKLTSIVFKLSGGSLIAMLLMIMVACIILGMGLPSTAAYIIAATVGVPSLIKAGIPVLPAHMFVFYFAIISFITPPVALAAYAASGLSGANAAKTGVQAFFLGISGFIIPFIYAYNTALLIVGSPPLDVIYITLATAFAVVLMGFVFSGWLKGPIPWVLRLILLAAVVMIFLQTGRFTDYIGIGLACIVVAGILFLNRKKTGGEQPSGPSV